MRCAAALCTLPAALIVHTTVTAVVGIFAVAFGWALLASRRAFGLVAMSLSAPVAAIGLSYPDLGQALGHGLIVLTGSVFSYVVSLLHATWIPDAAAPGRGSCLRQWPPRTDSGSDWRPASPPPSGSPSTRTTSDGRRRRPSS